MKFIEMFRFYIKLQQPMEIKVFIYLFSIKIIRLTEHTELFKIYNYEL